MRCTAVLLAAVSLSGQAVKHRWPDPPAWWLHSTEMTCVRDRESNDGETSSNVYQMTSPGGWSATGGQGWAGAASRTEQDWRAWLLWLSQGCHQPWGQYDGCC